MTEPQLFPIPRSILRLDPSRRHDHLTAEHHDATLPPQGYAVSVDDDRAILRHADDAGRRYGRQTLTQLRDDAGRLPTVELVDHPDLAVRGFMLDVSRDRVPTRETLDRLVTVLETCRYNHLQLYVEHTFAYRDHHDVWRDASPLDAEDLRWLRDRCERAGIELAANQNCFGHFGRWLAHDGYRWRAECPDGFELLPGMQVPPGVLAPTAENAAFALALVREQVAAFGARIVNV
ncbi:MAG: glycoside hydrolase, partial [Actinobacteria bacterium]|nr:glycoside hydrolase [Actinomycetota bacterium]